MQLNKAHRDCKDKRERKPYFQSSEWAVNYPPRLLTTSRRIKAVPQSILLILSGPAYVINKETRNWHEIKEVRVKCDRRYTLKRQKWFPVSLRGILQAVLRDSSCKIPALSVAGSTSIILNREANWITRGKFPQSSSLKDISFSLSILCQWRL